MNENQMNAAPVRAAKGHSRRTIVKGVAWSLPVIATAVAVPAHAASLPQQTACATDSTVTWTYTDAPVTPPASSDPHPTYGAPYLQYHYPTGTQPTVTATFRVVNAGPLAAPIAGIQVRTVGTNSASWVNVGSLTVASSRGTAIVAGSVPGDPAIAAGNDTYWTIAPAAGTDGLLGVGEFIEFTITMTALTKLNGGAYWYPTIGLETCGGWIAGGLQPRTPTPRSTFDWV
ncbi:hypothetical protein ACIPY5_00875 [Microbacterium sp. NPDC089698]|uniref:hypothetical protein n=1 Tax=Microbacterium sp. NPDC089698 TaxID=3364200 RepID=UPI0038199F5F